jgi:hypothetical protein
MADAARIELPRVPSLAHFAANLSTVAWTLERVDG